MAHRWYGINRGDQFNGVSEGSSTPGKDIEVDVNLSTTSLFRSDVDLFLQEICDKILAGNWPPAANSIEYRGYGLNKGTQFGAITEESPSGSTGTITAASVLEGDTVTLDGTVLTAQDGREKFTVLCVADSAGSLNNTYFTFSKSGVDYYVWYNVNSAGTDPLLAGKTAVPVAVATNAANTAVASATNTAIDALAGVSSTVSSATVTVVIDAIGGVTDAAQGAVTTGFTITVTRQGASVGGTDKFLMNTSDTATGDSLVTAIAANATTAAKFSSANAAGVVTLTALVEGVDGDSLTLATSNNTRLAKSGTTLASGGVAASGKAVRVEIEMAAGLSKNEVYIGLKFIRDYILSKNWPPA